MTIRISNLKLSNELVELSIDEQIKIQGGHYDPNAKPPIIAGPISGPISTEKIGSILEEFLRNNPKGEHNSGVELVGGPVTNHT